MRRSASRRSIDAFEEFFLRHERRLRAFALRRAGSAAEADELVADVMEIAWRRFASTTDDPSFGWLCQIALNAHANRMRSRRRLRDAIARVERAAALAPWLTAIDEQRIPLDSRRAFAVAWDALDSDDRIVLSMVAWDGLTNTELADALNVSDAAARKRLSRARERFRTHFERAQEGGGPR